MELRCIIAGNWYIKLSIIGVLLLTDSIFCGYLGDRGDKQREEYKPKDWSLWHAGCTRCSGRVEWSNETNCFRLSRQEESQAKTVLQMPKEVGIRSSKMWWSMMSKAAFKSSETSKVESPWCTELNIWPVVRRSEVSVEWFVYKRTDVGWNENRLRRDAEFEI